MPDTMIEVKGLTKRYRDHVAVSNINFAINKGEVVGFLGPNGAGKSTTMRMLVGCLPATSGQIQIGGIDVFDHPIESKKRIGYLPEVPPVYLDMTVSEYLKFAAQLKGVHKSQSLKEEIERCATLTGVDHILPRLIRNVSKGYWQRIGLAGYGVLC